MKKNETNLYPSYIQDGSHKLIRNMPHGTNTSFGLLDIKSKKATVPNWFKNL